jgi:hypothetical protein
MGGRYLAAAEKFLDGADVVTALQEVSGEGMAQRVATGTLVNAGRGRRGSRRAARSFVIMMPALGHLALPQRWRGKTHCQRQSRDGRRVLAG